MADKREYEEFQKKWSKVIAKAWFDESFKQKLLKNPEATCQEMGIGYPGVKFVLHENTEKQVHLVLPPKPKEILSQEQLQKIAGAGFCCHGTSP